MNFKEYINKEQIQRIAEEFKFPNNIFIELLVHDYRVFSEILKLNKNFVLKGGAAAQIYIPLKEQRTSIDIDLITNLPKSEVDEIMKKIGGKKYEPKNPSPDLPLSTYLVDIDSAVMPGQKKQLKIDIIFENPGNYKIKTISNVKLFMLELDFDMPMVSKGSLMADKLLTLARKSIGINASGRVKEVPKQIYDLIKLRENLNSEDINDLLFSFKKISELI